MFPAVGNVVQDGRVALRSCIEYLHELYRSVKRLEQKGLSIEAIRDELFGGESDLAGLTDGQFSSENLIRALLHVFM